MPAVAGTPRYEKRELWLGTANWHGGFCYAPPPTPAGDKPLASRSLRPRYIFSFPILGVISRFGGFRVWGGVLEVYWIACFHSSRACRLPPAQRGMNYGGAHASRWIRALALTPTLSQREREKTLYDRGDG